MSHFIHDVPFHGHLLVFNRRETRRVRHVSLYLTVDCRIDGAELEIACMLAVMLNAFLQLYDLSARRSAGLWR